jgi:RND family efflux transporter MFP subunit
MNYEAKMFGGDEPLALPAGEEERPRRRLWLQIGAGVAIVAVLLVAWYLYSGRSAQTAQNTQQQRASQLPTVTVAVPGRRAIEQQISGTGSLAAKREMPVGVAGEGGMVTRVLVEPGDWVAAGQVLAEIDRSVQAQTAQQLEAQVRVARADADLAQANLERAERLVSNGFVSKADLDQRRATRDAARARVRVAEASLAETRARNRRLDIRAPAAGLVLTRGVEPGQIVSSGSGTLFRLAMGGQMEMRAQLSEDVLHSIHPGSRATVVPVGTTRQFVGQVWQVSPIIDTQTRQGVARIALSYDPALRPGGFATATIIGGTVVAPLLPQAAVQSDTKGNFVYILNAKNEAVRVPITTGEVSDQGVAITSGLKGDERVVLTAGAFLNPGQKVIPNLQKLQ